MTRRLMMTAVLLSACGGPAKPAPTSAPGSAPPPSPPAPAPAANAPPATPAVSTASAIELPGVGNGVWWDAASRTLFVTDDTHGTLVAWTDAGGLKALGAFQPAGDKLGLGAIVRRSNGSFIVPSFGFGKTGTLLVMASDGHTASALTGLDKERRRIAISASGDKLYEAFFVVQADHQHVGGIATVAISDGTASETAIPTTMTIGKLAGLAATPDRLYVCDQEAKQIDAVALPSGQTTVFASLPGCDQLALMPSGALVTGTRTGALLYVAGGSAVAVIASSFDQVRGVAYDAAGKRLFVIDHRAKGSPDQLHIIPYVEPR
jgi:hypothetical protein